MTYEEYRAARDAEEAEAEAKRKADREARRAAELAKTPEQRQAELEAMPFEERYAREKVAERLRKDDEELAATISRLKYRPLPFETGHIGLGKIETADLRAVNDAIASAEFEPRRIVRRLLWLAAAFASVSMMFLATYSSALGDRVTDLESRLAALEAA